jgi:hypothetical protein
MTTARHARKARRTPKIRRPSHRFPIADLGPSDRAVLDALVAHWLRTTPPGRDMLAMASVAEATAAIYRHVDTGLMQLEWTPGDANSDLSCFAIRLTPSGWAEIAGGGSS